MGIGMVPRSPPAHLRPLRARALRPQRTVDRALGLYHRPAVRRARGRDPCAPTARVARGRRSWSSCRPLIRRAPLVAPRRRRTRVAGGDGGRAGAGSVQSYAPRLVGEGGWARCMRRRTLGWPAATPSRPSAEPCATRRRPAQLRSRGPDHLLAAATQHRPGDRLQPAPRRDAVPGHRVPRRRDPGPSPGEDRALRRPALVDILDQLASGLTAAHVEEIVDRDLKPGQNIFLVPVEGRRTELVKILDFGISKIGGQSTRPGRSHRPAARPSTCRPNRSRAAATPVNSANCVALALQRHERATQKHTTWSTAVTWVDVLGGDYNGDGKTDIAGVLLADGQWWVGITTANSGGTGFQFNTTLWETWSAAVTWADVLALLISTATAKPTSPACSSARRMVDVAFDRNQLQHNQVDDVEPERDLVFRQRPLVDGTAKPTSSAARATTCGSASPPAPPSASTSAPAASRPI